MEKLLNFEIKNIKYKMNFIQKDIESGSVQWQRKEINFEGIIIELRDE